ncbi:unnamed protein product [Cyprideis torosa]|uniref:Uncharacterized protein n=1 Tax=Cyprideis torosa TaxID=163714 RepID=A0A7R8WLF0_9CRUS|nr:unnamed protein product [Cyprideis torosa]CAG0901527.1 unnamed protein product [Cyprideis torosa]
MAESELANKKKQAEDLEEEVKTLQVSGDKLQELYSEQDDVLGRIFGGDYGSPMENRLEAELDELEFQRAKILEANFKWRQAQMMMEYACKQMAVAVQKWRNLEDVPQIELEVRYSLASETRNNLIAATQNISGAQRYLENVQFPYCTPAEVDTLNKRDLG